MRRVWGEQRSYTDNRAISGIEAERLDMHVRMSQLNQGNI